MHAQTFSTLVLCMTARSAAAAVWGRSPQGLFPASTTSTDIDWNWGATETGPVFEPAYLSYTTSTNCDDPVTFTSTYTPKITSFNTEITVTTTRYITKTSTVLGTSTYIVPAPSGFMPIRRSLPPTEYRGSGGNSTVEDYFRQFLDHPELLEDDNDDNNDEYDSYDSYDSNENDENFDTSTNELETTLFTSYTLSQTQTPTATPTQTSTSRTPPTSIPELITIPESTLAPKSKLAPESTLAPESIFTRESMTTPEPTTLPETTPTTELTTEPESLITRTSTLTPTRTPMGTPTPSTTVLPPSSSSTTTIPQRTTCTTRSTITVVEIASFTPPPTTTTEISTKTKTTTRIAAVTSLYAACMTDNYADYWNGQGVSNVHGGFFSFFNLPYIQNAYDCCVAAFRQYGDAATFWSLVPGVHCHVGVMPPGCLGQQSLNHPVLEYGPAWKVVGNGPCGQFWRVG